MEVEKLCLSMRGVIASLEIWHSNSSLLPGFRFQPCKKYIIIPTMRRAMIKYEHQHIFYILKNMSTTVGIGLKTNVLTEAKRKIRIFNKEYLAVKKDCIHLSSMLD